jgi:hypothetical protein
MRNFTLAVLLFLSSQALRAQVITDSIRTQASYAQDVYYSLNNGQVKALNNNSWHLAFRIGGGLSIRSNAATASNALGSVVVYEKPGKDTTQWAAFDTTGLAGWQVLDNTDTTWEYGAFNVNKQAGNPFDFSWGVYNMTNHHVIGNRLYLVSVRTATGFEYKKVWIVRNALGTWTIKYANLNGTNEQVKEIRSTDHAGYNFAYLSLLGDSVYNHEPLSDSWDFVLTRYAGLQPTVPPVYYPVTGILTNTGVQTAEVRGKGNMATTLADTAVLSSNISEIGSDWKQLNASFQFYIPDSLTYFIKAKDGAFWKLNFVKFAGSSTGNTVFTKIRTATSLNVDTALLMFPRTGGSKNLVVTSNGNWTISVPSWLTATPASGNGNATVAVTAANPNATTTLLANTLVVTGGHLSRTVQVFQEAALQAILTDTIRTGASYANDVYYSLTNGKVKEVTNSNWQLAFSIGATNVAVRSNATTNGSGIGSVQIFQHSADTNNWNTLDTAGFSTWTPLDNSDSLWSEGALNSNPTSAFNYGWGTYDMGTHIVTGNRLYIAAVKTGASATSYKKVWIVKKNLGLWTVKYADLDGSNERVKEIVSADFAGKNFAYLSLLTDSVHDREPLSTGWDFVLTRYAGLQPTVPPVYYPVTGILTNSGVTCGEVRHVHANTSAITDTTAMTSYISEIGSDWKQLNMSTFAYYAVDSLSYFIKAKDGELWKVVFKGFSSAQGTVIFTKQRVPVLGVNTAALSFVAAGEAKPVSVTANSAWTATTNEPWISLSSLSGTGNATLNITALVNNTTSVRTGTVMITSGSLVKTVAITQAAAEAVLTTDVATLAFDAAAAGKLVEITSNTGWTVENATDWITVSTAEGTGNATLNVVVTANEGGPRSADILVKAGSITRTVTVSQDGATGLADLEQVRILSAYPNPSTGTITVSNELATQASVEVYNISGVKVSGFSVHAAETRPVDLSALPSGIYMMHILSGDVQQHTRLLIAR